MTTQEGLGELIMQRPISEYEAMSPEQILNDPDAPETLKIRARNKMEREAQEGTDVDRQRTSR